MSRLSAFLLKITGGQVRGKGPAAHLTHAVVRQLDVAVSVEQDIVQLQVPVDDPPLVQEVESNADLSSIEPGAQTSCGQQQAAGPPGRCRRSPCPELPAQHIPRG